MKLKFFQNLFDIVDVPTFVHDAEFKVLLGNQAYYQAANMTEAEAMGKVYWDVFPRGNGPLLACESSVKSDSHIFQKNIMVGTTTFAVKAYHLIGSLGQPLFVHVLENITEHLQLQTSEERYHHLFESANHGILFLDTDTGVILDANPCVLETFGYNLASILGKSIWDLDLLSKSKVNQHRLEELKNKQSLQDAYFLLEMQNGETLPIELTTRHYFIGKQQVTQCDIRNISKRARAEHISEHLNQLYRTVSRCNKALVHADNELELCDKVCHILHEEAGFRRVLVVLDEQKEHSEQVNVLAGAGELEGIIESLKKPGHHKKKGLQALIRQGDIIRHVTYDENKQVTQTAELPHVIIPFKVNYVSHAALIIYGDSAQQFSDDVIALFTELAQDLAFGIGHLRAMQERIDILEKLKTNLDKAVTAIAATVEMRDPYTAGHQHRVETLALAIAAELDLPDNQRQGLRMACAVHDIGKIHVPAEILASPSKLSEAEFAIIKTHSTVGWEILKGIDFPWPVAEIVYQHHERMDGSGYPRGLKGDEILIETKILMVADVVEAMTSHRPYRPSRGLFAALQEITQHKGKLYDSEVVDACLRLFLEKKYEIGIDSH